MPTRQFSDEELALLDAIHADPRDDAPRLAYADWLGEHGEPEYAEFIRIQQRTCRKVYRPDKRRRRSYDCPVRTREYNLCREHSRRWIDRLPRPLWFLQFYRGLPQASFRHEYFTPLREWDAALRAGSPRLRYSVMVLANERFEDRLAHPLMQRVNTLKLYCGERGPGGLYHQYIDTDAIKLLADQPWLEKLEGLYIESLMYDRAIALYHETVKPRLSPSRVAYD